MELASGMGKGTLPKAGSTALTDHLERMNDFINQSSPDETVMNFSALPLELQELILSKLPLVNLAQGSATCKLFQAIFREQLAREEAARCNFAAECFGRERIIAMVVLLDRWLKGEALDACQGVGLGSKSCCISQDGKYYDWMPVPHRPSVRFLEGKGVITSPGFSGPVEMLRGWFDGRVRGSKVRLIISRDGNMPIAALPADLAVCPFNDHDLEGVALVQALLSEGLAKSFRDAGHEGNVGVWEHSPVSAQGRKTLLAPLKLRASPWADEGQGSVIPRSLAAGVGSDVSCLWF